MDTRLGTRAWHAAGAQGKLASDQLPQRGVGALSLPFALSNRAATRSESEMAAAAAERATPSGPGGGAGSPSPGLVQHTFSAIYQEQQQLFFQLVVLQRQIFAWVGTAPPRLASLCLATPTRLDPVPAATSLLPGPGAADEDLTSMAQRIAKRVRQSVALSVNLPANQPLMRAFAEKRLLQELQALQLVQQTAGMGL